MSGVVFLDGQSIGTVDSVSFGPRALPAAQARPSYSAKFKEEFRSGLRIEVTRAGKRLMQRLLRDSRTVWPCEYGGEAGGA